MKQKLFLRSTALALAILLLAGCSGKEASRRRKDREEETTVATVPAQREMTPEEKEAALRRLEYALICAAIDTEDRLAEMDGMTPHKANVYLGDWNGDGAEDLIYGPHAHTFDALNRCTTYQHSQSGFDYYTDKDGTLYRSESIGDSYENHLNGTLVMEHYWEEWFCTWNGSEWTNVLGCYESSIQEIVQSEEGYFLHYGETLEEDAGGRIGEQAVSPEEYEAHVQEIRLTKVETQAKDFTQLSFDGAYADDLMTAIADYMGGIYGMEQVVTADYDGDGQEETVYFVYNVGGYWYNQITYGEFQDSQSGYYQYKDVVNIDRDQRYVLLADREDGKLNITTGCIPVGISVYQGMNIRMDGGFLWLDSAPMYLPGTKAHAEPSWFGDYVQLHGYSNCLTRAVDVSDLPGNEYMCLAQKDGVWYVIILIVVDGSPRTVYTRSLENTALYLTEQNGKQCLLLYTQQVRTLWDGRVETWYDYTLLRIGTDGLGESLDYQFHSYTSDEPDATATAAFFDKLNVYLIKIVVVRDPYRLTGTMWMPSDGWSGSIPTEPAQEQQPTEQPKSQMGFVQINDPGSWLNLREGPGTEYPRVLMDPADPESYVKQALGSPVTVLETIETGDAENPVWLKIRITYGDREFVGYSSKTYIRLVEE